MPIVVAAPAEPSAGWGRLVALMVTAALFYAFTQIHKRWKASRENPSPTDDRKAVTTVKSQVRADSDSGDSTKVVAARSATNIDTFVAERIGRLTPSQIVREARRRLGTSEASVWRALRRARRGDAS